MLPNAKAQWQNGGHGVTPAENGRAALSTAAPKLRWDEAAVRAGPPRGRGHTVGVPHESDAVTPRGGRTTAREASRCRRTPPLLPPPPRWTHATR